MIGLPGRDDVVVRDHVADFVQALRRHCSGLPGHVPMHLSRQLGRHLALLRIGRDGDRLVIDHLAFLDHAGVHRGIGIP